jgi:DNA-binding MarR family transcriptional regulator
MTSIFSGLITSKTRIKILMRLFLNPKRQAYLRELADEFNASPSQVREELRQLNEAGFLESHKNGRQIHYKANQKHPLFHELQSMVQKALGMDRILESILERLGNLEEAYLIDDYAEGKDTGIIDLILIGDIDQNNLTDVVRKTERYIDRKIRTLVLTNKEWPKLKQNLTPRPLLKLWHRT